jgi:hypothetical protein
VKVDDNDESRLTAVLGAWSLIAGESGDSTTDYARIVLRFDRDRESPGWYGERRLKTILSKWIQIDDEATMLNATAHLLNRFQDGVRVLKVKLEMRDDDLVLGQYVSVDTARLQQPDGSRKARQMMIVKKRPPRDGRVAVEALDLGILQRVWFYAPDGLPDYDSASDEQKRTAYLSDTQGLVGSPTEPGYNSW